MLKGFGLALLAAALGVLPVAIWVSNRWAIVSATAGTVGLVLLGLSFAGRRAGPDEKAQGNDERPFRPRRAMKKKLLVAIAALAVAAALFGAYRYVKTRPALFKAASGEAGPFAGKWANVDPNTWGIRRIEIGRGFSGLSVKMWARCDAGGGPAQECDWGSPASYDNRNAAKGLLSVEWGDAASRRMQQLSLLPDGRLRVLTRTTEAASKQGSERIEYFARAK